MEAEKSPFPAEVCRLVTPPESLGLKVAEKPPAEESETETTSRTVAQSHSPAIAAPDGYGKNRRDAADFEPFPLECLPDCVRRYATEKAAALNQNPAGLAFALMVQAGAHAGAAVKLRLGNDRSAAPILWYAVIGISGCGKSPLLEAGVSLIQNVETQLYRQYNADMEAYRQEMKEYERSQKEKGKSSGLANAPPPTMPGRRKIAVHGTATIEGIHRDLQANPRGLLLVYDELAAFFGDTERGQRSGASAEWLSGYNGATVNSSRKTSQEVYIPAAWWSIIGGSTPERLESILRNGHRVTDGTLSRFCLVWPPEVEEMTDADVSEESIDTMKAILTRLIDVEDGDVPYYVNFDVGAAGLWKTWRKEIFQKKKLAATDAESSFLAKSEDLLARIALILHLLEAAQKSVTDWEFGVEQSPAGNDFVPPTIGVDTFQKASTVTGWIMRETEACYRRFGFIAPQAPGDDVLRLLEGTGAPMTARDIGQKLSRYRDTAGQETLHRLLAELMEAGKLRCEAIPLGNNKQKVQYSLPE